MQQRVEQWGCLLRSYLTMSSALWCRFLHIYTQASKANGSQLSLLFLHANLANSSALSQSQLQRQSLDIEQVSRQLFWLSLRLLSKYSRAFAKNPTLFQTQSLCLAILQQANPTCSMRVYQLRMHSLLLLFSNQQWFSLERVSPQSNLPITTPLNIAHITTSIWRWGNFWHAQEESTFSANWNSFQNSQLLNSSKHSLIVCTSSLNGLSYIFSMYSLVTLFCIRVLPYHTIFQTEDGNERGHPMCNDSLDNIIQFESNIIQIDTVVVVELVPQVSAYSLLLSVTLLQNLPTSLIDHHVNTMNKSEQLLVGRLGGAGHPDRLEYEVEVEVVLVCRQYFEKVVDKTQGEFARLEVFVDGTEHAAVTYHYVFVLDFEVGIVVTDQSVNDNVVQLLHQLHNVQVLGAERNDHLVQLHLESEEACELREEVRIYRFGAQFANVKLNQAAGQIRPSLDISVQWQHECLLEGWQLLQSFEGGKLVVCWQNHQKLRCKQPHHATLYHIFCSNCSEREGRSPFQKRVVFLDSKSFP